MPKQTLEVFIRATHTDGSIIDHKVTNIKFVELDQGQFNALIESEIEYIRETLEDNSDRDIYCGVWQ